jgi:hypothetical protein
MINKNRIVPVATLLLIGMLVTGPLVGFTDGQILTETTYHSEDFEQYNETAIQLSSSDELQSQHLSDTGNWTENHHSINHDWTNGPTYASADSHRRTGYIDSLDLSKPWLQTTWEGDSGGSIGMYRKLDVPDDMDDPVLVIEHADWNQDQEDDRDEVAVYNFNNNNPGQIYTTDTYDDNPGWIASHIRYGNDSLRNEFNKVGWLSNNNRRPWQTHTFDVSGDAENITVIKATRLGQNNNNDEGGALIRQLYWVDGSPNAFQTEVNGFTSVSEDDSFGGPDPYPFSVVNEPTAEGEQTSIRSYGFTTTREYTLNGISTDTQKVYFELDATSNSKHPVNWRIEQYGQEVASGSVSPRSSAEDTAELNLNDDTFTLYIESKGQYDVHGASVTALEETSAGDPLASEGPIVLDAQNGYDNTIGMFIDALDITTTTLLYIVMIALIIGAMAFSYTKSVRGQKFGQSMMYGAIITGVVMVGLVPTMNAATWIFTGGTDRAPLANPALEAEPPTYYSTEFQAGTMDGWEDTKGMARPVSSGEGFNLDMTADGEAAVIQKQVHISLGNSLDTGFVRMGATASSTPGYTSSPHETSVRARIYVTDGSEPNWETGYQNPLTESEIESNEDLVVAQEWARSFDGQVVNEEGTISFPMEGNTIYVELVAYDNRDDELASGSLNWIAVGATTEGTGEAV